MRLNPIAKLKKDLAQAIADEIDYRGVNQTEAARIIRQTTGRPESASQVSLVCAGKLHGFSVERLIKMLSGLSKAVTVRVAAQPGRRAGRIMADVRPV